MAGEFLRRPPPRSACCSSRGSQFRRPALTWKEGISTLRPLTVTWPWRTIWRAWRRATAKPRRYTTLSRRRSSCCNSNSPVTPLDRAALLEVVAELAFLGEVHALRLLLLAKLKSVAHDLGLAVLTVLPGCEIALFDRTLVREALCALEEQFHSLAAAKAAYCVSVPCQVTFS